MAAITALAVAGAAASAAQAVVGGIQNNKANKVAEQAAIDMRNKINNGPANQFAGLQAPTQAIDVQDQKTDALAQNLVSAAADSGAEGVIGATSKILAGTHAAGLASAGERAKAEFEVEKLKAGEQSRLDQAKQQGLLGLDKMKLEGAQTAAAEGKANLYAGLGGILEGGGNIVAALGMEKENDEND